MSENLSAIPLNKRFLYHRHYGDPRNLCYAELLEITEDSQFACLEYNWGAKQWVNVRLREEEYKVVKVLEPNEIAKKVAPCQE